MLMHMLRYALGRSGVLGRGPVEAGGFVRSTPDQPRPDLQFHFTPWGVPEPNTDAARSPPRGRRVSILPGVIYPRSLGEIRLASKDPFAAPAIDPRYFSDDADLALLVHGVRLTREIAATAPLAQMLGRELAPGVTRADDAALRDDIRRTAQTIFHPVGTCRMGIGTDAVVDPQLRVRGIANLRIVDASIMPRIIGGNTNAPCIMIAEKAADLIRGRASAAISPA
jgi:choline dehydrogenase